MSNDRYVDGSTPESGDSGLIQRYLYAGTPSDPERMMVNEYGEVAPSVEVSGTVSIRSLDDARWLDHRDFNPEWRR